MRIPLYSFFILITFIMNPPQLFASSDLKQGDLLYSKRAKIENAYQALSLYTKHLDREPSDVNALWRASMANYYIGHLLKKEEQRLSHYKKGIDQGKLCIAYSKKKLVECYFWLATNTALLKKENGIFSLAFGIGGIISLFEEALQIDPKYAGSGPYRMLALLYYKAPGFLGGDTEKAYRYIEKSIELSPNEPLNYFFHIKFLKDDGELEEAMKIANHTKKVINPEKLSFLESRTAYQNILYFLQNKNFPKKK